PIIMYRKNLFIATIILIFLWSSWHASAQNGKERPNVIIVITDDQGKDDLGCYGNEVIRTPNLDEFYRNAIRLDNFHVSTTCAPTRSSLMTGKHSNRLNVFHTIAGRS